MNQLFQYITRINNPWTLSAFGVAAVLYMVLKKRGRVPALGWVSILTLVLGTIVLSTYVDVFRVKSRDRSMYRVRVTVIGPDQMPDEQARIWSSAGGEPKKISTGWEFDIPASSRPSDGKVTIFAAVASIHSSAQMDLMLEDDYNPIVVLRFPQRRSAPIQGVVIDDSQSGVDGATVSIVGYEAEETTTRNGGQFVLVTHAVVGEEVLLRVEKQGYVGVEQYYSVGDEPTAIVMSARSK